MGNDEKYTKSKVDTDFLGLQYIGFTLQCPFSLCIKDSKLEAFVEIFVEMFSHARGKPGLSIDSDVAYRALVKSWNSR